MAATNGYDLLLEAASSLTGLAILEVEDEPSDADLAQFLSVNREALDRARAALRQPCKVPLEYTRDFFQRQCDTYSLLRDLARSFTMEFKGAERLGNLSDAMAVGLTMHDLTNAVRRGGMIVDMLVANAIESLASHRLRHLRHRFLPDDASRLANALLKRETEREPFDSIAARDRQWEEIVGVSGEALDFSKLEWPEDDKCEIDQQAKQAIIEMMQEIAAMPDDQKLAMHRQQDDCNLTLLRLLAVESALLCYHARTGTYPSDLSHLAPDCIATVPLDPFTGTGFKYRPTPAGFVLYSLGPRGHDHGGTFGSLLHVLSGEADLGIDMYDYRYDDSEDSTMASPRISEAVTPDTRPQCKGKRWYWGLGMFLCMLALLWCGASLYQRVTYSWQLVHVIPGFVDYGSHETEFSPDGTRIAIAHVEQAKVLDWVTGKELVRLKQYKGQGIASFSADGRIVSYFSDGTSGEREACLWNASDGSLLGRLRLPKQTEAKRCWPFFSPDNKKIVAACGDGLITWDSSDLDNVGHIKISQNPDPWLGTFMAWQPITHEMTGVDADGQLLRIDLQKETAVPLLANQKRAVKAAKWSPDGTRLVTIDREKGTVAVWEVPSGAMVTNLSAMEVVFARFSPDGKQIVTTSRRSDIVRTNGCPPVWDRRTQIWDAESGNLIQELPTTTIVTFSPDWSFWVDAGPEGVRVARFDGSELCVFPQWFDGHGSTCVFSQDNRYLAYVNGSGLVVVWQRHDPVLSWTNWLTLYQLWCVVLAAVGLVWSTRNWKATRGT